MHAEAVKYLKVLSIGVQDTFVYRWNFLLRALFGIVPLLATVFIWRAVFAARQTAIGTYNLGEIIFYFLLILFVESLVTPTEDEWRIAAEIREGQISALITKPLNHLAYRFGLFASYRGLYTCITLPIVALVFLGFREYLRLPAHWVTWPAFIASVGMAALIQFFIAYSLAMLAFWILEISTVMFIVYSFEYLLSGQIFPLDILPVWLQAFLKYCPFTYELYFPRANLPRADRGRGADPGARNPGGPGCCSPSSSPAPCGRGACNTIRPLEVEMTARRYFEAYRLMVRNSLVREMSFKANFILWMVVELLWFMGQIVFIEVLFGYVDRIGDWSKWQVVALFGTHQLISQLFQGFFFQNLSTLPDLIRTGKLDLLLLLPIDAQFAVSTWRFGLDNMVNAVVGCAIVAFSLAKLHLLPGAGHIALYCAAVAMGVAIQYSLLLALSTFAFWIVRAQGIIFGYFNLSNIGRYPDVIYRGVFKVVFSYFIPMILVANVPVRLLTGAFVHPLAGFAKMFAVTLCIVLAGRAFWVIALRRYSSASS